MALWYRAVSHPGTEYGLTNFGPLTVDTASEAAIATVLRLALVPLVLLLARWFAAGHAALAVRLLGPSPTDAAVDESDGRRAAAVPGGRNQATGLIPYASTGVPAPAAPTGRPVRDAVRARRRIGGHPGYVRSRTRAAGSGTAVVTSSRPVAGSQENSHCGS